MYNLSVQERLDIIEHKLKFIPNELKPSILLVQSLNPLVVKTDIRSENVCKLAGGNFYNSDFVLSSGELNPDVILVSTNLPMQETFQEIVSCFSEERWAKTPAVKNNRVYVLDNFVGSGNAENEAERIVSVEIVAEILYPDYFTFGYEGDRWLRFELQFES